MRMKLILVATALTLTGCDGKPSLPSDTEAEELLLTREVAINTYKFVVHDVSCAYGDPKKSAKTDEWMAVCSYDMTAQELATSRTSGDRVVAERRLQGDFPIFWREKTSHDGTTATWEIEGKRFW